MILSHRIPMRSSVRCCRSVSTLPRKKGAAALSATAPGYLKHTRFYPGYAILFDEAYLLADDLDLLVFLLIILDLLLLEVVAAVGVDGYDQRSELFDMAVPQGLRHAEVFPLCLNDLFNLGSCYNSIACREYAVDRAEIFACSLGIFFHAALSDDYAHAGGLHELILEFFHTHGGGRAYRYHLVFVIAQRTDDRACVEDRSIANIDRKVSSLFYNAAVSNVTAGRNISVEITISPI